MIDVGVHIYGVFVGKKIESYLSDRLTFSNIHGSRQIYRLALLLRAPVMLSLLSKSRISFINAHLALFV